MSRITSSIGLITGIPIEDTVNQLMQLAARPRDLLVSRNKSIQDEQTAVNTLSTRLLGFQFAINKLKSTTVYSSRTVTSSNKDALSAAVPSGTTPPAGTVVVRPVRTASSQQLLSQRFESLDASLSTGSLSLRMGGFVNKGAALEVLNGGAGVPAGKIKITDRSGASATIDLTYAQSVDDVLVAINQNAEIGIKASVVGDSFRLTDVSGGSGNLLSAPVARGSSPPRGGFAAVRPPPGWDWPASIRPPRLRPGETSSGSTIPFVWHSSTTATASTSMPPASPTSRSPTATARRQPSI